MAQRCTACHVKSGKTCDGCVFRGLFPFAEQGKADFKALSEVYSIDFLRSSLVSMDRDQKEIFISSLLFELEQQRIYPDGGAGQAIQNADNQTFDYDQRDIEANELLRYSRQRSNLFNRSLQRNGSHDGADESKRWGMNLHKLSRILILSIQVVLSNMGDSRFWDLNGDSLDRSSRIPIKVSPISCPICCEALENLDHLLFCCDLAKDIARFNQVQNKCWKECFTLPGGVSGHIETISSSLIQIFEKMLYGVGASSALQIVEIVQNVETARSLEWTTTCAIMTERHPHCEVLKGQQNTETMEAEEIDDGRDARLCLHVQNPELSTVNNCGFW
ncbi:RNA-directed DNA polymerase, eukaryota [Tanacetum coccineum]|uniref:RNA-directed DNA polymerase, eukaryota n=1 Tax=Tanacetum coccineum TaxID=301880 RepID=A0ABQ4XAI4_9ASTR